MTKTGQEHQFDQWLVNGSPDFGTIPGGLIQACKKDTPIHLFRGNFDWGWAHISHKHGQQRLFRYAGTVEEMVWAKCAERGDIHQSRDVDGLTVSITVAPTAFMVLKYRPRFGCFSLTTMYSLRRQNQEPIVGQYVGPQRPANRPIFAWLPFSNR